MELENTNEAINSQTTASKEDAIKKVKELYELIIKIKMKYYSKAEGLPEHEKKVVKQLQVQMSKTATEHSLKDLYIMLEKSSKNYDNPNNMLNNEQFSEEELRQLYNAAIKSQVAALKIGNLTRAIGCQGVANRIMNMLKEEDTKKICLLFKRKFIEDELNFIPKDQDILNEIFKENYQKVTGAEKENVENKIKKMSRYVKSEHNNEKTSRDDIEIGV